MLAWQAAEAGLPAVSVLIPASWTPAQALAVLELLNHLRDALRAIHGDRIQDMVQQVPVMAGLVPATFATAIGRP